MSSAYKYFMARKNFCNLPWRFLIANADRPWYKFCCWAPELPVEDSSLPYDKQPRLIKIKNQLLNDQRPVECNVCWQKEDKGLPSFRTTRAWTVRPYETLETDGYFPIEINLGNTCNLQCLMCGPEYSSKWATKEALQLKSYQDFNITKRDPEAMGGMIERLLKDHGANCKRMLISGGEPSITPLFYQLSQIIIERCSPGTEIMINTNGMFGDSHSERFLQIVAELSKKFTVTVYWSIDASNDAGEFLRWGLDYNGLWKQNIKAFEQAGIHNVLQITTTAWNMHLQTDLIKDINTWLGRTLDIKPLYTAFRPVYMNPELLGDNVNQLSWPMPDDFEGNQREYVSSLLNLFEKISKLDPDTMGCRHGVFWMDDFQRQYSVPMPEQLRTIYDLISKSGHIQTHPRTT